MRRKAAGVMPSTRAASPTVSNGAFAGPYLRPAARYSGSSAPLGRRKSSGSRQSAIASTSAFAAGSSRPPVTIRTLRSSASGAALMSIFAASSTALATTVALPSVHRCGWPSNVHASGLRGRISSNAMRSTAPSAIARACASETALRVASASLRMLNAKPLAITVSSTVSHSASTIAMPDCVPRTRTNRRCGARATPRLRGITPFTRCPCAFAAMAS